MPRLTPADRVVAIVALPTPLVAAVRSRRPPPVALAAGADVAYLVHTGVDWDWETSAVTLTALVVGVAPLAADETAQRRALGHRHQSVMKEKR